MRGLFRKHAPKSIEVCDDLRLPQHIISTGHYSVIEACDLVVGHVPYGIVEGYNERAHPIYAVMLREPIARTLSLYRHVLSNPDHYQHK